MAFNPPNNILCGLDLLAHRFHDFLGVKEESLKFGILSISHYYPLLAATL
jgi:hypothetical protein